MTLQQISDVSQAVAAIAVVLSLIALIIQMRQSTKMMRATAVWDAQMSFVAINETLAEGGVLSDLAFRVPTSAESLSPYERHLWHRYMRAVLQRVEAQFALYRNGILDAEIWELRRNYTKSLLLHPLVSEIWLLEKGNSMLSKAFIAELDTASASQLPAFMGRAAPEAGEPPASEPRSCNDQNRSEGRRQTAPSEAIISAPSMAGEVADSRLISEEMAASPPRACSQTPNSAAPRMVEMG
jgi:hypothetical protein